MVEQNVIDLIKDEFSVSIEVTPESRIEDLALDSLEIVELVMAIEDDFKVLVSDEEAEAWVTVRNIIDCIVSKQQEGGLGKS